MQNMYIAVVEQGADDDYEARFPDLAGCIVAADSLATLAEEARDVLGLYLAGIAEDGCKAPAASGFDAIVANPENLDDTLMLLPVTARRPATKAVRVNVTFDAHLLEEIDRGAEAEGLTRAAFLAKAGVARAHITLGQRTLRAGEGG
jgi:predicted RNase H-like HicB family nuclease